MPDVIEIDLKNPYFKLNYPLILKKMEEGAAVILHKRQHAVVLMKILNRKKYQYGFIMESDNTWKVFIKQKIEKEGVGICMLDEKYEKIFEVLFQGGVLTKKNMGELLAIIRAFKKYFPKNKKIIEHEKGSTGYSIWLK